MTDVLKSSSKVLAILLTLFFCIPFIHVFAAAPVVVITSPQNNAVLTDPSVQLEGTIDGVAFSETRILTQEGETVLTKTAVDSAGNTGESSVTVSWYYGAFIGPAGGELTSADGKIKLIIPSGALTESTYISLRAVVDSSLDPAAPENTALLSAVECRPSGLVFTQGVTLVYTLPRAEVPGTFVELGLYDAVSGEIEHTGQISSVAADGYTVTFSIIHFSTYAALKSLVPAGGPLGGGVKVPLPDMLTGSFSHAVSLTIPPGRKGMQPNAALVYRSSNANSWTGVGFMLNPGYIVRSTRLGPPSYIDEQDTFYYVTDAGTVELVHLTDNLYQAKIESGFSRFYKESDDSWRVVGKDNSCVRLGQTPESKEGSVKGTFAWYVTKATDSNGNYIEYSYVKDEGKSYLSRIDYTGSETGVAPTNTVEFFLEPRTDVSSSYITSAKITTAKRLNEIRIKVNSELVWKYVLTYAYSADSGRSLLKSVVQQGSDGAAFPATEFEYQSAE